MVKATRDIGASVRARLLNLARERGQVLDLLLTRYALERLLYRLSLSAHRNRFVLFDCLLNNAIMTVIPQREHACAATQGFC